MSKKAQIKIGETIGVLIIVYIGLLFGMSYFTNIVEDTSQKFNEEIVQDRTFNNFNYILNNPMLKFQVEGQSRSSLALNSINLEVFKEHIKNNEIFYYEKLGPCLITIKLYRYNISSFKYDNFENITVFNRTLNNNKNQERAFYNFMNIRDIQKQKTFMGIMEVKIPY